MEYPASRFHYWRGWPQQAGYWYDENGLMLKYAPANQRPTATARPARHEADQFPDYLGEFLDGCAHDSHGAFQLQEFSKRGFDSLPEHVKQTFSARGLKSGRPRIDIWNEGRFPDDYATYLRWLETLDLTVQRILSTLDAKGHAGNGRAPSWRQWQFQRGEGLDRQVADVRALNPGADDRLRPPASGEAAREAHLTHGSFHRPRAHHAGLRWLDPRPHAEELYNLRNDPDERQNVAADPA